MECGDGDGKPPLCKGRWIAKQDGGIVRKGLRRGEWRAGGEYLPLWGRGTAIAVDEEIIPYIAMPFTRILNSSPNNVTPNPFFSAHAAGANTFANSGKSIQKHRKRTASS